MDDYIKMTFDEFKTYIRAKHGFVSFREQGKNGWDRFSDVGDFAISYGTPGPHWCDAVDLYGRSRVIYGTYDFDTGSATFF